MPDTQTTQATPAPALAVDDARLSRLRLLDVSEVARLLSVSGRTVLRMSARGELPQPIRLGPRLVRWRLTEIEAAIRGGRP